jgi:hypothetical protein
MPKLFYQLFREVLTPSVFHRRCAVHLVDAGE